jgi:hypothetical protein
VVIELAIAGGAALIAGAAALFKRRRPGGVRVAIADAAEGVTIEIAGTIVSGATIEAPLTGRACVHYDLEIVEESRGTGAPGLGVRRGYGLHITPGRLHEVRGVTFTIEDDTGRALIDPAGAEIHPVAIAREMTIGDPTVRQRALLVQHHMHARQNRFREGVLAIGDRVAVIGTAVREPDPDGAARAHGYRGDTPTRLRLGGSAKHPLVIRALDTGA